MIAAPHRRGERAKLLTIDPDGRMRHFDRNRLATLFQAGDLVVANDAATLPASLAGTHTPSGRHVEVRLAAWIEPADPRRFIAVVFGSGDYRTPTERRSPPPPLVPGDRLSLGPLRATIVRLMEHPRLVLLTFDGSPDRIWAGIAHRGGPIQYAHVPEPLALWDVWTSIAARPLAFEAPSAGLALDWATLAAWRRRNVGFATLTHAAGLSSTGDVALDRRLPFDEPYSIPAATAAAIRHTKEAGGRIVAIGTTVVRAIEAAADADGSVAPGDGIAIGRIEDGTRLRFVDAILTGVHRTGESHFELLRAFADDRTLDRMAAALEACGYRAHEFGDSVLIDRQREMLGHTAGHKRSFRHTVSHGAGRRATSPPMPIELTTPPLHDASGATGAQTAPGVE
jgi:S-adenosylmethionine:tRNA ribosyltransferase-isomerase